MGKFIDLSGSAFGRLTVVKRAGVNGPKGQPMWECVCECGSTHMTRGESLRNGRVRSCGCLQASEAIASKFWDSCDRSGGLATCWPWRRAIGANGYGHLSVNGSVVTASRYAYELTNGPIPEGEGYHGNVVMHTCDNRACVNPAHLCIGSQRDNSDDRDAKGRTGERQTGEKNYNAVFTEAQVRDIRRRISRGDSLSAIADEFECSKSAISHIKCGHTWAWLADLPLGQAAMNRAVA